MTRSTGIQAIEQAFPDVSWTGGHSSPIHRSWMNSFHMPVGGKRSYGKVMTVMAHSQTGQMLWDVLQETFTGCEWLLTGEEFEQLMLVDVWRHMNDKGDSASKGKIKNPRTGNVFHRLMLRDHMVGGIRFWVSDFTDAMSIGFRFRVAVIDETQSDARVGARQKVAEAQAEYPEMVELLGLSEPSDAERAKAKAMIAASSKLFGGSGGPEDELGE